MYKKKLKNKSIVYINNYEDGCEVSVAFEDARFDFDLIDKSLNLLSSANQKVVLTRSLDGSGQEVYDALKSINTMIETQDKSILSPYLNKQVMQFNEDVLEAQLVLVDKEVAKPGKKSKKQCKFFEN